MQSMQQLMQVDTFAWPWMLCLVCLPMLVWGIQRWRRDTETASVVQTDALVAPWNDELPAMLHGLSSTKRMSPVPWMRWVIWALLCLAAARPQQLGVPVMPAHTGRDVMLALDLSASMAEEDMQLAGRRVDRLTAAKAVLMDFLQRRVGDRAGLIVFADQAFALTPLTLDRATVQQQLDATVLGLAGRATALGDAIALAIKRFNAQNVEQKVLIVLTDGVNTAGSMTPERAAQIAHDAGVRIYTVAIGGDGAGLTVFGMRLSVGGDEVDEAGLQRIAELTGGRAFRARATNELADIYAEIDALEPVAQEARMLQPKVERYFVPLVAALCLVMLQMLRRRLR